MFYLLAAIVIVVDAFRCKFELKLAYVANFRVLGKYRRRRKHT